MEVLDRRLQRLERYLGGSTPLGGGAQPGEAKALSDGLQERVEALVESCPSPGVFEQFLTMYRRCRLGDNSVLFSTPVDAATKRELLLAAMPQLQRTASQLEQLKSLATCLDSNSWRTAEDEAGRLARLESEVDNFARTVMLMHHQLGALMERYGRVVQLVSEKLVSIDALLERLEESK